MPQFAGWTMTRLEDYEQCPLMCRLKHLDKICKKCWKGVLMGFDPSTCDTCGEPDTKPAAWERGTQIGNAVNKYLLGKLKKPPKEIRNLKVIEALQDARKAVQQKRGYVEEQIVFNDKWEVVKQKTKDAWLRVKLDFLFRWAGEPITEVIDWKTGSIDKRTGGVDMRKEHKYDHQLGIYNTAVVAAHPEVERATARLVFLDVGPRFNPVHSKAELDVTRRGLKKAQEAWNRRSLPILKDKVFAPRPGYYCDWCDYSKSAGGPCKF